MVPFFNFLTLKLRVIKSYIYWEAVDYQFSLKILGDASVLQCARKVAFECT